MIEKLWLVDDFFVSFCLFYDGDGQNPRKSDLDQAKSLCLILNISEHNFDWTMSSPDEAKPWLIQNFG